ncbi:MAG: CotH kinase family protein [Flavobacteriales bacterium]
MMTRIWNVPAALFIGSAVCFLLAAALRPGSVAGSEQLARYGRVEDLLYAPTALQWRRPMGDFPWAMFTTGPVRTQPPRVHSRLAVVSLVLPYDHLFDPEHGLYTVGHAILHDADRVALKYLREPRWWKYPGNYLFRGKEWERSANIEIFDGNGEPVCNEPVGIRINGNTTRGFPQKALRVSFFPGAGGGQAIRLFGDDARHYDEIVLRASGNDQDRTMFRDAVQHRLCEALPFDVSRAVQSVVYINGAYWGIHNIRERVEDDELAIRYGLKKNNIVVLADRALPYRGDDDGVEAKRFKMWLKRMERMDPQAGMLQDSIAAVVDPEGFLHYMAAQIIFGNTDWPDQNVKFWRFTGKADTANAKTDGRWRFIMGDSDLSFGYAELPADAYPDMFAHLERKQGPVARLFRCCMRSPEMEARFGVILRQLLDGSLSGQRMESMVHEMARNIDAEMHRQVRRWRRPRDHAVWQSHVHHMVTFARGRSTVVWGQWQAWQQH